MSDEGIAATVAAPLPADTVLAALRSSPAGRDAGAVARLRRSVGANAVRSHHAQRLRIVARQFRSAILISPPSPL